MSSAAQGGAQATSGAFGRERGLRRRTVATIVAAEVLLAALATGVARHDAFGWVLAGVFVLATPLVLLVRRRRAPGADTRDRRPVPASRMRVMAATSRSSGEVGVLVDEQGYAAALELSMARGAVLELGSAVADLAADPVHLCSVQLRITSYSPSGVQPEHLGGYPRGQHVPVHRRVHLVLRFEPARARDVVQSRGGGSEGSRAALVAAVDRAALRLRRAGMTNRIVDAAALETLLTEDSQLAAPNRLFAADLAQSGDIQRLLDILQVYRPQRSVVSLCVDLATGDEWRSTGTVLVTAIDERTLDAIGAALRVDDAVVGVAAATDLVRVLPLGGGPGDLVAVVSLERT